MLLSLHNTIFTCQRKKKNKTSSSCCLVVSSLILLSVLVLQLPNNTNSFTLSTTTKSILPSVWKRTNYIDDDNSNVNGNYEQQTIMMPSRKSSLTVLSAAGRGRGRGGGGGGRGGRGRGGGRGGGRGRGRGRGRGGGRQNSRSYSDSSASQYDRPSSPPQRQSYYNDDDDDDDPFGDYGSDESYNSYANTNEENDYFEDEFEYDDEEDDTYNNNPYDRQDNEMDQQSQQVSPQFFSRKPISDPSLNNNNEIFQTLAQGAGITKPSKIQALAWPTLLQGSSAIVADQTGSGKTLSYLLPLLQRMIHSKDHGGNKKQYGAPKVLIMAPTAELADQIKSVCDKIQSATTDTKLSSFSTKVITATGKYATNIRDQIRLLQTTPVDVLITTPGRIATILRSKNSGYLNLSTVQSIVLDEVDILLIDETFGPQLRTVGAATARSGGPSSTQFVFVTATLPDSIVQSVTSEFPNVQLIKGPGLHRVALTVKEHLVDVSVPSASNRNQALGFELKSKMLMKALRGNRCRRTLIFCNTVENCRKVENLIRRSDRRGRLLEVGAYHNAMTPESRNKNLGIFSHGLVSSEQHQSERKQQQGGKSSSSSSSSSKEVNYILVCTDRAARGVDFEAAPVDHVILFDFPKDPAEYVRRVGRTARAGRMGTSTVLAYGWQLPIARKIMGSKLESFTVAADSDNDEEDAEYTSKQRQARRAQGKREKLIGGNIQGGRLWD